MSKIIDGIVKDLKAIPETLKAKTGSVDKKKLILMNLLRECHKALIPLYQKKIVDFLRDRSSFYA